MMNFAIDGVAILNAVKDLSNRFTAFKTTNTTSVKIT